ncbi:MAG: nitrate/nitrite transporter NrtS [Bacteroidota bacterium]|nr:nitrate/nitrite transporter NrtS [Bacteroidota bacterium]
MRKENYFTALKISLLIGTVLNTINSYDALFNDDWTFKLILKVLLTYCVPFGVSLYSSWKVNKQTNKW